MFFPFRFQKKLNKNALNKDFETVKTKQHIKQLLAFVLVSSILT